MPKNKDYYISKGFDEKTAEYFANGRRTAVAVEATSDFELIITFDNGETRLLDVKDILKVGTVFEPFMEFENFKRVYIDTEGNIAWDINPDVDSEKEWNNKVDISTDTCYIDSVLIEGGN